MMVRISKWLLSVGLGVSLLSGVASAQTWTYVLAPSAVESGDAVETYPGFDPGTTAGYTKMTIIGKNPGGEEMTLNRSNDGVTSCSNADSAWQPSGATSYYPHCTCYCTTSTCSGAFNRADDDTIWAESATSSVHYNYKFTVATGAGRSAKLTAALAIKESSGTSSFNPGTQLNLEAMSNGSEARSGLNKNTCWSSASGEKKLYRKYKFDSSKKIVAQSR